MRTLSALAVVVLAASAIPAVAQQKSKSAALDPDKMVCKRYTPVGSMIPSRKECHTRKEWGDLMQRARADGQEMMDRRVSSSTAMTQ